MKKAVAFISSLGISLFFFAATQVAHAQSICPTGDFANLCKLKLGSGSTVIGSAIAIILILAVILSLFFLLWGGIRWIMSGGDKAKIDQARSTIIAAIVGLVIAFLAFFVLNVVTTFFLGHPISAFTIPTLVP